MTNKRDATDSPCCKNRAYRYLCIDSDGTTETLKSEGNFHETENQYQAYVYYKDEGGRYWQLVGYRQLDYSSRR